MEPLEVLVVLEVSKYGFYILRSLTAISQTFIREQLFTFSCLDFPQTVIYLYNSFRAASVTPAFQRAALAVTCPVSGVSIRPTTGIKPLYTTIATVTMNLIVSAAIVLLNPYVTIYISYKIPPFALSVHIPDVSTSIYVEVDSKVLLGLPFCDKAFVR